MFLRARVIVRAGKVPTQLWPSTAPRRAISRVTIGQFLHNISPAWSIPQESRTEREIEKYVRGVKKEYGENLPEGLLTKEEYTIYERYFGTPARLLKEGEEAYVEEKLAMEEDEEINIYNTAGELIETVSRPKVREGEATKEVEADVASTEELNKADAKAYTQIAKDIERAYKHVASYAKKVQEDGGEEDPEYPPEEEDSEVDEEGGEAEDLPDDAIRGEESYLRIHPLSRMGRFATFPFTIEPPEALTGATEKFLSDVPNKHLDQAAHRAFTDIQLSSSPINTEKKKNKSAAFPIHPDDPGMTDMQANVHFATVMPGLHAQALSALTELRRRLGRDWALKEVNRILDVGSGGAGVLAWQGIVDAEESANGPISRTNPETLEPENEPIKATVITAAPTLRYRSAQMLDNTTFLPRIPDVHPTKTTPAQHESNQTQQPRKFYDLIIASNTILPIREDYKRKYHVENLWSLLNPTSGVLLLIEKGNYLGFEAIAGARSHLLKYNISSPGSEFRPHRPHEDLEQPPKPKEVGQIIAPCTNHEECPMFIGGPGLPGRKDFCRFQQRYTRPGYMQRIMRATGRNHEDAEYSFVAVRRGKDARFTEGNARIDPTLEDFDTTKNPVTSPYSEESLRSYYHTLPRIILDPLKKQGHIILDLCTSEGKMERWTVPKSYGKTAFHDARKSGWGDLWALGAKTKVPKHLKIGKIGKYDKAKEERPGKIAWLRQKREMKEKRKKERVLHKKESKAQNWAKQKGIKLKNSGKKCD